MINRLRRHHLRLTMSVGFSAAVVLGLAVAARQATPTMADVPQALLPAPCAQEERSVTSESFTAADLRVTLGPLEDSTQSICLTFGTDPRAPDLLVYWSATPPSDSVPAEAFFLGPIAGTRPHRFELPPASIGTDGQILVYALATGHMVASGPVSGSRVAR